MKKLFFLIFIVLIAACNQNNKFEINGEIEGVEGEAVYLKEKLLGKSQVIDSAKINQKGIFSFKHTIEYPKFYQLGLSDQKFITLLIKPGEEVKIWIPSGNFTNYTVEGSVGSQKVKKLENRLRKTTTKLDSLSAIYNKVQNKKQSSKKLNEIDQEYQSIIQNQRDSSIAFILDNLGSMASIMALYQKINEDTYVLYKNRDLQYIKLVADSLQNKYPGSEHVKALIANKDDLIKKYNNLAENKRFQKYAEQSDFPVPVVKLPDLKGDTISLKEVDEKMLLLSFYSTKDRGSLQRNLKLKNIYKKYHSKGFEIYQVNLDKDMENWEKSVRFDELPWISVGGADGRNQYYGRVYNVTELPTDFLLNKEREIIARNPDIEELKRTLSVALD